MKFSITHLEQARQNPAQFAKMLKNAESTENKHGGYPKSMRWLDAVCEFHKNDDISEAFDALENALSGRKPTAQHRRELRTLLRALDNYKTEAVKRKFSFIKSRAKIYIKVNEEVEIGGIIPLIFMNPAGGFSAYFISPDNAAWKSELRFPVVQSFVAETVFKTSVEEIEVGYINYLTGEFQEISFSPTELVEYDKELKDIGRNIWLNF